MFLSGYICGWLEHARERDVWCSASSGVAASVVRPLELVWSQRNKSNPADRHPADGSHGTTWSVTLHSFSHPYTVSYCLIYLPLSTDVPFVHYACFWPESQVLFTLQKPSEQDFKHHLFIFIFIFCFMKLLKKNFLFCTWNYFSL